MHPASGLSVLDLSAGADPFAGGDEEAAPRSEPGARRA